MQAKPIANQLSSPNHHPRLPHSVPLSRANGRLLAATREMTTTSLLHCPQLYKDSLTDLHAAEKALRNFDHQLRSHRTSRVAAARAHAYCPASCYQQGPGHNDHGCIEHTRSKRSQLQTQAQQTKPQQAKPLHTQQSAQPISIGYPALFNVSTCPTAPSVESRRSPQGGGLQAATKENDDHQPAALSTTVHRLTDLHAAKKPTRKPKARGLPTNSALTCSCVSVRKCVCCSDAKSP